MAGKIFFIPRWNKISPLFLAVILVVLVQVKQYAQIVGKAIKIIDGDTFIMLTAEGQTAKIRLYGIDCPERKQALGEEAKKITAKLVLGKKLCITVKGVDRYKRIIAVVRTGDGVCVNEKLLQAGLAWHYTRYDRNIDWFILELTAKKHKKGVWALKFQIAPWLFRRRQ